MSKRPPSRRLLPIACAILAWQSTAESRGAELHGVEIPDRITCGDRDLVINGTAVRSVWGFKVYVVGLYLAEPIRDGYTIMNRDRRGKRMHITMLRGVAEEKFTSTIQGNIDENFSASEKRKFSVELARFLACFKGGTELGKGCEIDIDFLPSAGTTEVTVNGQRMDTIPGGDFYHALLRLWIGKPPQDSIRQDLISGKG